VLVMKLGYTLFYVDDVEATMKFYSKAFGLEVGFMVETGEFGEMVTGDTKLGFVNHETASSHGFEYDKMTQKKKPAAFEIGFVTDDVDGAFSRAVKAGAVAVSKPAKKPWGQMVSYVRDCNGFLVEICSPMG
jgi:predicted enzyme related to lactoylglutathione lyase